MDRKNTSKVKTETSKKTVQDLIISDEDSDEDSENSENSTFENPNILELYISSDSDIDSDTKDVQSSHIDDAFSVEDSFDISSPSLQQLYLKLLSPYISSLHNFITPSLDKLHSFSLLSVQSNLSESDLLIGSELSIVQLRASLSNIKPGPNHWNYSESEDYSTKIPLLSDTSRHNTNFIILHAKAKAQSISPKSLTTSISRQWSQFYSDNYDDGSDSSDSSNSWSFSSPSDPNNFTSYFAQWSNLLEKSDRQCLFVFSLYSPMQQNYGLLSNFIQTLPVLENIHFLFILHVPIILATNRFSVNQMKVKSLFQNQFVQEGMLSMWPQVSDSWNLCNIHIHTTWSLFFPPTILKWIKYQYINIHNSIHLLFHTIKLILTTWNIYFPPSKDYLSWFTKFDLTTDKTGCSPCSSDSLPQCFDPNSMWRAQAYLKTLRPLLEQNIVGENNSIPQNHLNVHSLLTNDTEYLHWLNKRVVKSVGMYCSWLYIITQLSELFPTIDWITESSQPNVFCWKQIPQWSKCVNMEKSESKHFDEHSKKFKILTYLRNSSLDLCNVTRIAGHELFSVYIEPDFIQNMISPPHSLFIEQALLRPFHPITTTLIDRSLPLIDKKYWPDFCLAYSIMPKGTTISLNDWFSNYKALLSSLGRNETDSEAEGTAVSILRNFGRTLTELAELGVLSKRKLKFFAP